MAAPILVDIQFANSPKSPLVPVNTEQELQTCLERMRSNTQVTDIHVYRRAESFSKEMTWKQH